MDELVSWIDRDFTNVFDTELYRKNFQTSTQREDEGRIYLSNQTQGIELILQDHIIKSIFLFSGNYKESKRYLGILPFGIQFSFSRRKIHTVLGEPNRSGGEFTDIISGYIAPWDKYFLTNYFLHFQYFPDMSKIDLITIGSLSLEKYFDIGLQ